MKYRLSALAAPLILVALVALGAADAHAIETCPRIRIECPDEVAPGEDTTFRVVIDGADPARMPIYQWEVTGGSITGGQGTSSITVALIGLESQALTANVEVGGFPAACQNSTACTIFGAHPVLPRQTDSYANVGIEEEHARLNDFADALRNEPGAQGYVIAYAGRRERAGEAVKRGQRARSFLVTERGIESERVVVVDGGYREELTVELYVVPTGAQPPEPTPTVDPSEVEIIVAPKTKRGRNPRPR